MSSLAQQNRIIPFFYTPYPSLSRNRNLMNQASMAASVSPSCALMVSRPPIAHPPSSAAVLPPLKLKNAFKIPPLWGRLTRGRTVSVLESDFDIGVFSNEIDFDDDDDDDDLEGLLFPRLGLEKETEEKDIPPCPPGLRRYNTLVVIRPDLSEDKRIALTEKYEELLVAGGGMYVEVYNRGVIPLCYDIKMKNKDGETNTYYDGIFLVYTYFTKPESIAILNETLLADDNVIRSLTSKVTSKNIVTNRAMRKSRRRPGYPARE